MKNFLLPLLLMSVFSVKGQDVIQFPLLKKQIDSLGFIDKKVGQDVRYGKIEDRDSLRKIVKGTFIRNTELLKKIFSEYGFPNYDKVGKGSSKNFWLCVQHSNHDLKFQQDVLKVMENEVKSKKADPSDFAYLTDRVNINLGKPQIYGTQLSYDEHKKAFPVNLKDPRKVNKRRKAIGLEPVEDYLQFATEAHRQMNSDR
ncbi:hypothetical protein H9X96_18350 [Pedobacter sp. N36a]|uniref:DUF6624 domain-containing protein n=1 Tax=Pedobacter sp. N36a TaxID=2767996 RepID=UPI001656A760|nr:DUF6624 domain-containing protein [Pedobacter sp. N36a]MBC8987730.1 hypothetical protein [Pedobacter sp. N36a]